MCWQNPCESDTLAAFLDAALVFSRPIRFHCWPPLFHRFFWCAHAIVAVLAAHPERESERGGDRVTSVDAARGHDPAGSGGCLHLAAAWRAGIEEGRPDLSAGGTAPGPPGAFFYRPRSVPPSRPNPP